MMEKYGQKVIRLSSANTHSYIKRKYIHSVCTFTLYEHLLCISTLYIQSVYLLCKYMQHVAR